MTDKLTVFKKFFFEHRRLPSFAEICSLFNFKSKNAAWRLVKKLTEDGFLAKSGRNFAPTFSFFALPFLGHVKAGFPVDPLPQRETLSLDQFLIEKPESTFILRVSGDSLCDVGIFPDDLVLIEKRNRASVGQIVLAEIDQNWTLKILAKDSQNRLCLQSANDKYSPFYPQEELKIFGVVKSLVRKNVRSDFLAKCRLPR